MYDHNLRIRRTRQVQSRMPRRLYLLKASLPLLQRCPLLVTFLSGFEEALGIFSPSVLVLGQGVRYSVQGVADLHDSVGDHFCQPRESKRAAKNQ